MAKPLSTNNSQPALTHNDVKLLLQNPTIEAKAEVLDKVSTSYNSVQLNSEERQIAEQIFRLLVQDSAIRIRTALSDNLKNNPSVPKDIIITLANDEEAVSTPILSMSEVLDTKELLDIINNSAELWRYMAIASRETVSEQVSDALVDVKHIDIIHRLLDNDGANISTSSYAKITDHAKNDENTATKLAGRNHLPLVIVEKLMAIVSQDIAEQLRTRYHLDKNKIQESTDKAHEQSIIDLIKNPTDEEQTLQLVNQLKESNRLSSSIIINALCHGNILFFEISLSSLANLPLYNTRILLNDKGKLGFRALYNKTKLPTTMYHAVKLLFNAVIDTKEAGHNPSTSIFSNEVVVHMLQASKNEKIDNLSYILALLRQRTRNSF